MPGRVALEYGLLGHRYDSTWIKSPQESKVRTLICYSRGGGLTPRPPWRSDNGNSNDDNKTTTKAITTIVIMMVIMMMMRITMMMMMMMMI